MMLPDSRLPWPIVMAGVALIAERESCRLRSYKPLPTDPWTNGWGQTGEDIGPNTVWTQEYADQRFCQTLTTLAAEVRDCCTVEPNDRQLGAMVSLAYNTGMGWKGRKKPPGAKDGFRQSTVLRQHNVGNFEAAARAFSLWNKSAGQVVAGLVSRRLAEAALYLQPHVDEPAAPMPQAVEAESKLTTSPIAQAGTVTAGAGVVGVLAQLGDQITAVKGVLAGVKSTIVDTLGVPADWVLPLLLVGIGIVIVRYRRLQRTEGHA